MATIAASTGTGAGGFIHLRPSHLPPHPRSASPCFTASCSPCRFRGQPLPRGRLRRAPRPASAPAEAAYTEPESALLEALLGRTFVGVDSFRIFQEVYLRTDDPRVVNVVRFSESVGDLRVEAEDQNWSSIASAGLKGFQIIEKDGQLKNSMSPLPGVNLNASGNICKKENSNTFSVSMKDGAIQVGGVQFPLDVQGELVMEILYVDNKIKISRLNQHMLVHLRITQHKWLNDGMWIHTA
ncbi:hypothetical protein PR202_ga25327 [Eleusine coracana subsp. coracana]|uniref:Uncharacterized protein n=1 Tax=Eleusine coracana subsp. coracana TaxID=191504 RepID=A0AAV5DB22_ELECO|nr:hypothetical protein PR202_ga25327 [Eleusine coracana subsp. coracana]